MEEKVNNIFTNLKESVGVASPPLQKWSHPKKGKLRIMPISDSPWAPTGFGTNTKNISAILYGEGHHIGYGGCQNDQHCAWTTPWPLNQTEKLVMIKNSKLPEIPVIAKFFIFLIFIIFPKYDNNIIDA